MPFKRIRSMFKSQEGESPPSIGLSDFYNLEDEGVVMFAVRKPWIDRMTLDLFSPETKLLPPTKNAQRVMSMSVQNGVASINIEGPLAKKMDFWMWLEGGTAMEDVQELIRAAADDESVDFILLNIDSPGGTVSGTAELAQAIFEARQNKSVIAYGSGDVASGAYWLASAADKIFVSPTTTVGSISVAAMHVDTSKLEERFGVKITDITSGKYKRIASSHAPLTKEGKATIQETVDALHDVFVADIARFRGRSEQEVGEWANGKTWIGQEAVDLGLVDGIETFDNVLSLLTGSNQTGDLSMKKDIPSSGANATPDMVAERSRIQKIITMAPPGCEKLAQELAFEKHATVEEAYEAFLNAGKEVRANYINNAAQDSQQVPVRARTGAEPERSEEDVALDGALARAVANRNAQVLEAGPVDWQRRMKARIVTAQGQ